MLLSDSNNTIYTGITGRKYLVNEHGDLIGRLPPGREEAGKPARGLSTHHKCGKSEKNQENQGTMTVYTEGSLIKVSKNRKNHHADQTRDWVRGQVKGFSKASRRRIQRKLAKLDKNQIPVFVTLTYPSEWPEDPQEWKRHLKNFIHRLAYKYPNACGVWKLEPQKRGAPHYHLMIWGVSYDDLFMFVKKKWYQVVGSGDINHLKAGTRVEKIRSWRGVMSYVSKYIAKMTEPGEGWENVGRYWGVFMRDNMPWSEVEIFEIPQEKVVLAMRYFRRYAGLKSRDYASLSIYINNPKRWKKALLC